MNTVIRTIIAIGLLLVSGCADLTTPDSGDVQRLADGVSKLSAGAKARLVTYAMNRHAWAWLIRQAQDEVVGRVECLDEEGFVKEIGEYKVEDLLLCMDAANATFVQCTRGMIDALAREVQNLPEAEATFGKLHGCEGRLRPKYDPEYVDQMFTDPEAWEMEDVAEEFAGLKDAPPPIEIQMLLFSGGLFGAGGVLCPLASWGCPDSPYTGAPATPSDPTGGDR